MSFLSNLFGGGTPQVNFTPSGVSNPTGFSVSGNGGVSNSSTLSGLVSGLSSTFTNAGNAFGGLLSTVAPNASQARKAGLASITSTFNSNLSNLKGSLAQRNMLGSSFANSAISENAANEASTKANFLASVSQQEFNDSMTAIQSEFEAYSNSYSTAINQSNIETATAASLVASNNQIGAQVASANAELTAQAQQGAGSFLGSILGAGATLGGSYMTSNAIGALATALA